MRTFWKGTTIGFFVLVLACTLIIVSMYWWPDMSTSPRPEEGRIYPLNNHGHSTYMNEWEHQLERMLFATNFLTLAAMGAIYHFVDPFDFKRRIRPSYPVPPY